jgi:hypothetical protein
MLSGGIAGLMAGPGTYSRPAESHESGRFAQFPAS